jgi:hypothetical protein
MPYAINIVFCTATTYIFFFDAKSQMTDACTLIWKDLFREALVYVLELKHLDREM